MRQTKTIIIGGGASGLYLSSLLSKQHIILEQNSKVGKKILASGGGKCNITNKFISSQNYLGDAKFIDEILSNLSYKEVLDKFSDVKFNKIKNNQFFANSSKDVLNSLLKMCKNSEILTSTKVQSVKKLGDDFILTTNSGDFSCKYLVVASGGLSAKALGVSDIGYNIAMKFNHKVSTLNPALVGFTVQKPEFWMKSLSGVSLKGTLKVGSRILDGELLFTHKGISGPVAMNASLFWQKGECELNFMPNFNLENIRNSRKQLVSVLPLPRNFIKAYLKNFNLLDKPVSRFSDSEFEIIKNLQSYKFAPAGNFGYEKAEITKGGICVSEISNFCESKICKNLYFIGEILDVSGMIGGFNLHFAFASAKAVAKKLNSCAL